MDTPPYIITARSYRKLDPFYHNLFLCSGLQYVGWSLRVVVLNPGVRRCNSPPFLRITIVGAKRAFGSRPSNSVRLPHNGSSVLHPCPVAVTTLPLSAPNHRRRKNGHADHGPVTACAFHNGSFVLPWRRNTTPTRRVTIVGAARASRSRSDKSVRLQ